MKEETVQTDQSRGSQIMARWYQDLPALAEDLLTSEKDGIWQVDISPAEFNQAVLDAIYKVKNIRWHELEAERKRLEAIELYKRIMTPFTPGQLFRFWKSLLQRGIGDKVFEFSPEAASRRQAAEGKRVRFFSIDEHNMPVIRALCYYFTNDKRFENPDVQKRVYLAYRPDATDAEIFNYLSVPFSLDKGICLFGDPGTGKSILMKGFSRNKRQCYEYITCEQIRDVYENLHNARANTRGYLTRYAGIRYNAVTEAEWFNQKEIGIMWEDLGTEEKVYNTNVMEKVALMAYDSGYPFYMRHMTTNLGPEQIGAKYTPRVRSRFREMFNMLVLGGPDRRI